MPPRLNKRQQRELEELEALGGPQANSKEVEASTDDEQPRVRGVTAAGFSALFTEEDDQDDDDDVPEQTSKSKKSKKKKKISIGTAQPSPARSGTPILSPQTNEKKAAKRAKSKAKKAEKDELDQALAELSVKYPELQNISTATNASSSTSSLESLSTLLSVSLPHLDSEAEMRKIFGSKVVQASKEGSPAATTSRRKPVVNRSNLTRPQATWAPVGHREGLSIRTLTDEEVAGKLARHSWSPAGAEDKWWTIVYSKKYKSMTKAFMRTVQSGDPQGFYDLLRKSPYHADTLLQLAEVFRHRDEHAQAVDAVDRALFTYERSFIGSFNFTSGINRLDFDQVENRPFFLAIHRQASDLQRRGCLRTAFEFARLLYSLDPWNDPHGALLHLDFLPLKGGMSRWLLDTFALFAARRGQEGEKLDARLDPSVLPGWMYAKALALRMSKDPQEREASTDALVEAVTSYPSVVPLLADKLDVSLPASIRGHRDFKIETDGSYLAPSLAILHLLSHLYAQRSFALWKGHSEWFSATLTQNFSSPPSSITATPQRTRFLSLYQNRNLQYSVYRHIIVLESTYRRLFTFIPKAVQEEKSLACDPLPPPSLMSIYNEVYFEGVEDLGSGAGSRRANERRLAQLIPDPNFRRQLEAIFAAHPMLIERFGGDVVQFAQQLAELQPDVLEDILMAEAMGNEGDQRGMPGQLPGMDGMMEEDNEDAGGIPHRDDNPLQEDHMDEDVDEEDDEEDEDEEDIAPLPVRVLRNLFGRFWGGNTVEAESSEDEDAPPQGPLHGGDVD